MTSQKRLQMPASLSQKVDLPASRSAQQAIDRSIERQQGGGLLATILTDAKTRQLKAELAEIEEQHAVELAILRVDAAADQRIEELRLESERQRTELRDRHNARSGALARQQADASSRALLDQVDLNNEIVKQIEASKCDEEDKITLIELAKMMAAQRIEAIGQTASRPSRGSSR